MNVSYFGIKDDNSELISVFLQILLSLGFQCEGRIRKRAITIKLPTKKQPKLLQVTLIMDVCMFVCCCLNIAGFSDVLGPGIKVLKCLSAGVFKGSCFPKLK